MIQMSQSTVANSHHQIEARLPVAPDVPQQVDGDEIALTHEFMAIMIGAQRSGVTAALHVLEGTGMIRSLRGQVVMLDHPV